MLNQKEYFNSIADNWDNICNHNLNKVNKIIDIANIRQGDKILDVGTGTGVLIPHLLKRIGINGEIKGVDYSCEMLKIASKRYEAENVSFIEGDIHNITLKENYYDHIICYSVFPHFIDKQEAIANMKRFLKAGGSIIICHSQSREEINNLHKNASKEVNEDRLPNAEVINNMFVIAGMKPVKVIDDNQMFIVQAIKQ